MTDHEPTPPPRNEALINAAIEAASPVIARSIISSVKDRGGDESDAVLLLARVNALVIASVTMGRHEAKARTEDYVQLISENTLETTRKMRAQDLLRNLPSRKGLRP